jgi:hypothetical protein
MRHALIRAIGIGGLLVSAPALAVDNPACAKFDEPLAYNACLARFGPHAPEMRGAPAPEPEAAPAGQRRVRSGFEFSRGRHRRMRAEFNAGGKGGSEE